MTSRERLQKALAHQEPDRVPVDFGSTAVTGMHVTAVSKLRAQLTGDHNYRVKVIEPYQMLGEIDAELQALLGIDVVGLMSRTTLFGFENRDWKNFQLFDGTQVQVPGQFEITTTENGDWLIYPEGDRSAPASGHMPQGGYFFDSIVRQPPILTEPTDPQDNLEEFSLLSEVDRNYYRQKIEILTGANQQGVILTVPGAGFGDIALVPAPWLKHPRGIRDIEEWYISTVTRRDYVYKIFEKQCEIALKNLETLIQILGEKVQVAFFTGTDFGTQRGPFISRAAYRDLFKPFHQQVNALIHQKSQWKTFIHSCGSVYDLIPDFIDAGFDVLNPVQCSAENMDARLLKREFGQHLTFWGGGVNTQQTLAFGTPAEVYREVCERIEILGAGGGFVFNAIHNIQGNTPPENVLAMFKALKQMAQ
ncbi:methyltransferase [candidate division KSB1 bacterium]|nr:methyltransferase [candidate division KSB1 bacterium]